MRPRWSALTVVAMACGSPDGPPDTNSVLETTATSYVAQDSPEARFDYAVTMILEHRNTSQLIVRVPRCTATISHANYAIRRMGSASGAVAWDPDLTCATFGTPYRDLGPGELRTDTLFLRAPWQRSFNGQPIGAFEGEFYVVYETQICALVSPSGACTPVNRIEFVTSNAFTITTP